MRFENEDFPDEHSGFNPSLPNISHPSIQPILSFLPLGFIHLSQLNSKRTGLEDIFYQGLGEFLKLKKRHAPTAQSIEGTERILRVGLSRDQGHLEQGLGALASIGSVAPYVGLFGTVWGIMNAFIGLADVDQVTLATVAPGIAEALIATAIGLFAAIPAVLAFNHFTAKGETVYSDRALFAEEMVALLQRQSVGVTQDKD